jgi:hypothetical protein
LISCASIEQETNPTKPAREIQDTSAKKTVTGKNPACISVGQLDGNHNPFDIYNLIASCMSSPEAVKYAEDIAYMQQVALAYADYDQKRGFSKVPREALKERLVQHISVIRRASKNVYLSTLNASSEVKAMRRKGKNTALCENIRSVGRPIYTLESVNEYGGKVKESRKITNKDALWERVLYSNFECEITNSVDTGMFIFTEDDKSKQVLADKLHKDAIDESRESAKISDSFVSRQRLKTKDIELLSAGEVIYPPESKKLNMEGKVTFSYTIDVYGSPQNIKVVSTRNKSISFIESGKSALKSFVFKPIVYKGEIVSVFDARISFEFLLTEENGEVKDVVRIGY